MTTQRAALLRLREKALNGEPRALERFLGFAQEQFRETSGRASEKDLSATDEAILMRLRQDLLRSLEEEAPGNSTGDDNDD